VQCSQHMQKERAAELLREVQGGLRSGLCANALTTARLSRPGAALP